VSASAGKPTGARRSRCATKARNAESPLKFRLRDRLRGRLWLPSHRAPSSAFPCIHDGFRGVAVRDIYTSAGEPPYRHLLTRDPLSLAPHPSRGCAGRWLLACAALRLLVAWAWTVPLACRVVASRRRLYARTRPARPAILTRRGPAGLGCSVLPSLSRCPATGRCDGRRAPRPWVGVLRHVARGGGGR
jgi:hypothetical protein